MYLRGLHSGSARNLVSYILAPAREGQRGVGLGRVVVCRRSVHEHEGLRIASDRVGHKHRQRVVAVRDVLRIQTVIAL